MSVEFTHGPTTSCRHLPQYLSSNGQEARSQRLMLEGAFRTVVKDCPAGILTNMDVAVETARHRPYPQVGNIGAGPSGGSVRRV
ncbi:hypothetical protein [Mesorhizobium sp.]|uniref:hypothetical protein n=1 Tax=Mesorhizobium sp. TaxID=1871066 RepID=UPI001208EE58|nr:hypothetical protein [Mesorhizobium sp.]TIL66994.1 MAG: hypothetical protein E5Y77_13880 [Mesorhizobium sp.]